MDGEGAHAVEGRGLAIDGAGGRPGGAPGELVLADLVRGQGGGSTTAGSLAVITHQESSLDLRPGSLPARMPILLLCAILLQIPLSYGDYIRE